MELGATVCTPRSADCDVCPLAPWCAARSAGTQHERPAPSESREVPAARFVLAVLEREGRVLVERRPTDGLLGGLWAFPEERIDGGSGGPDSLAVPGLCAVARGVADRLGLSVLHVVGALDPVEHRFSHLKATYLPAVVRVASPGEGAPRPSRDGDRRGTNGDTRRPIRWIDPTGDESTALPVAQRKVLEAWRDLHAEKETV